MKKGTLKLLLSSLAASACAVSLTASTFAYVIIGNSVEVADFYFDIESQQGLLVSLDGINYSQDITSDALKKYITGTDDVADFDAKRFIGVTPLQQTGEIKYTGDYVDFGYDVSDRENHIHYYETAEANKDYIRFDLYLKAISNVSVASNFNLVLGSKTKIDSITEDIELVSTFTSGGYTYGPGTQHSTVKQSVKNAIRLGLYSENETTDKFRIFEVTDENDLGTTAIEGRTDSHDKASNIMYNYYNAFFTLDNFTSAAEDGKAYETINSYGTSVNGAWNGEYVSSFDSEGVAKVTVYLWLEGWDADYLLGTSVAGSEIGATIEFALANKV